MFDDVSGRYDLLNRLMTLGQDARLARARCGARCPESARVVLDLCTGSGVSLPGLRRPGRLVLGVDVSLRHARARRRTEHGARAGRRASCAPTRFQLPLRDGSLDASRSPSASATCARAPTRSREMARVLRPGGTLVVLEATAPAAGTARAAPSASTCGTSSRCWDGSRPIPARTATSAESIFEFGDGAEFEADLAARRLRGEPAPAFLLGATRLWVATPGPARGESQPTAGDLQIARSGAGGAGRECPSRSRRASTSGGSGPGVQLGGLARRSRWPWPGRWLVFVKLRA